MPAVRLAGWSRSRGVLSGDELREDQDASAWDAVGDHAADDHQQLRQRLTGQHERRITVAATPPATPSTELDGKPVANGRHRMSG
jgi:hypothetical protein